MALFKYKGIDKTGKEIKSTITSESLFHAKQKIRNSGVMLMEIKEQKSSSNKQSGVSFLNTVGINDLSLMTRQLATLLKARVQIVEALSALVDQTDNPHLRIILAEVKQKVNEGTSLAKALSDYPKIFNNIFVNMVEAGEASGTLHIVLMRLAEFTENHVKLKNKIKGAMTYPIIMICFGTVMMMIIFTLVIPKITKIFISMKKELPLPTKISIAISNTIQNYWWAIILITGFSIYLFLKYIKTKKGEERWHRFLLFLPVVGNLITMINVSRFCSTLATLLNSGVPILASMRIVQNLISNVHMRGAVGDAKINVAEGSSMTSALIKSGLFPSMVTHMILLGERSGELESMLEIISENYEDQVNSKLNGLTSILEPIMLMCMGIAVAFIIFSVVMPMMDLNKIN